MIHFLQQHKQSLMNGALRPLVKMVYEAVVALELFFHKLTDRLLGSDIAETPALINNVTIVIKTFERPNSLFQLIASIRRFYPSIAILIVDDSKTPVICSDALVIEMPFNSGISAGRNEGFKHVQTPFTLLLDDDFVFFRETNLQPALEILMSNPQVDLIGGKMINLPFYKHADLKKKLYAKGPEPKAPLGSQIGGLPVYEYVDNFFLCRTESVRAVGWDPVLKIGEHLDFFTRAQGKLLILYNQYMKVFNVSTPFNTYYQKFRGDQSFKSHIQNKYSLPKQ